MWQANWCRGGLIILLVTQTWGMHPRLKSEESQKGANTDIKEEHLKAEVPHNQNMIQDVEEYFVDHQVSKSDARKSAKSIQIESDTIRCDECTAEEMHYCLGNGVIDDHCCCDGKFNEDFPYIPHTCYRGNTVCRTVRPNCDEYVRVKECCCNISLIKKWKSYFYNASSSTHKTEVVRWIFILCSIVRTFLYVV